MRAGAFAREHPGLLQHLSDPHLRRRRCAGRLRVGLPPDPGAGQDRDRRADMTGEQTAAGTRRQDLTGVGWVGHRPDIRSDPRNSPHAGYDYVGFDIQHGYLDDADVAQILRSIEHCPDRHRGAAPDAGARADRPGARRRRRRRHRRHDRNGPSRPPRLSPRPDIAPGGVRSFGPLRASLGHDPGRAGGQGQRVRDDRDGSRARRGRRHLRRRWTDRNLRRPCRSGDLARGPTREAAAQRRFATRWRASSGPPWRPA